MERVITVKGVGTYSAKPDYVRVSMKLITINLKYDKAMELGAKQINDIRTSLVKVGFDEEDIKTTDFKVSTEYTHYHNKHTDRDERIFEGFKCRHDVRISFDFDMKKLGQVLDSISKCPAKPEFSVSFTLKNANAVQEELLRSATINARQKAEILCDGAGIKLGQLLRIDYNWSEINIYSRTQYVAEDMVMYNSLSSIDIEPDDVECEDTATFVWTIE